MSWFILIVENTFEIWHQQNRKICTQASWSDCVQSA